MSEEKHDDSVEKNRLLWLIASVVCVIVAVVVLIFVIIPKDVDDNGTEIQSDVDITELEVSEVENLSQTIMQRIGNFGINSATLTGDNARDVEYIAAQTPNDGGNFFTSRQTAYDSIREYIYTGSQMDYPSKTVAEWVNDSEIDSLVSFEIIYSIFEGQNKGTHISIAGVDYKAAYVDVTFSTKETMRHAVADDSTWDGSYKVLGKDFVNNTLRFTFLKNENLEWKLYSMEGLENQFLLATWRTPSSDAYATTQYDFNDEGLLVPTVKLTPPPEDEG